jgi:L-ascorbate metabolism protein UlaG (beta-lactamase superfamily)
MKAALFSILLFAQAASAGLTEYSSLVVADKMPNAPSPVAAIRVTYLGVNGYQFEAGSALLIDPYFTRVDLLSVASNRPIAPNAARVSAGLSFLRPHIAGLLATHAHFDHLLDAPVIMRRTHAQLLGGPTAVNLVRAMGIPREQCSIVLPGERKTIGPWKIRVLAAAHDRVVGSTPPFPGHVSSPATPPRNASEWKLGEPLAFVIEANGQRIYIDSGGMVDTPPPALGRIDLAILGVALPDSRKRLAVALRNLRPRYFLPSHQDDFFASLDRGFAFGKLTNFPEVQRIHEKERLPGRLILLDYFRPWTIR